MKRKILFNGPRVFADSVRENKMLKKYTLALSIATIANASHNNELFTLPNQAVVQSILEGNNPGTIIEQSDYTLLKSAGPYVFLVGNPSAEVLKQIATDLLNMPSVFLICDKSLHTFFIKHGFAVMSRISLDFPETSSLSLPALPEGFTIQPISNLELLTQCTWYKPVLDWYETAENFFNKGFGFALINNEGIVVAESYGAFVSNKLCEIGIVAHPNYQGKGYATLAARFALLECQKRGIKPMWSCRTENTGSLMIALKLGFQIQYYYAFLKKAESR